MTKHQTNALTFLGDRGQQFIEWIAIQPGGPNTIIGDMCPLALRFLDEQFRCEMLVYDKRSARYCHLVDMLIEIHLEVAGEFRELLRKRATDFFLGKAPYQPN